MNAFWYGVALQWKLDIRSKTLLITCYIVPLLFFAFIGSIFTSLNPEAKDTLIQSMTVMGVSMGALIGLPSTLGEVYGGPIKKAYKANGIPLYLGVVSIFISTFIHLLMMCTILYIAALIAFDATPPTNLPLYLASLAIFIAVSLSVGCVLGLSVKNQGKLTMISQLIFLPSIMLSGIMFPVDLLPQNLALIGKIFPASWGYTGLLNDGFHFNTIYPLVIIFIVAIVLCGILLKRLQSE